MVCFLSPSALANCSLTNFIRPVKDSKCQASGETSADIVETKDEVSQSHQSSAHDSPRLLVVVTVDKIQLMAPEVVFLDEYPERNQAVTTLCELVGDLSQRLRKNEGGQIRSDPTRC